MPALATSYDLESGVLLSELRGDLDQWIERLPDTAEQIAGDLGARARGDLQNLANGPIAVLAAISERVGFVAPELAPVVRAMSATVRVLSQSLQVFKTAARAFLKDSAGDLVAFLGDAARDLLKNLSEVSKIAAAIPVVGWIVAVGVQVIRAAGAVGRLWRSWLDKPATPKCDRLDLPHWAGPADRNAAADLLSLIDLRFNSGDLTAAFMPPISPGLRSIKHAGGIYSRISSFCFAPLLGSDLAAWGPAYLSQTPPDDAAERDAWRSAWFRASSLGDPGPWLRGPWLSQRPSRCEPSTRGNLAKMSKDQKRSAMRAVPTIAGYPKATAIAGGLFSQASGVGPFSLCVDWALVASAWSNAFASNDPAYGWNARSGNAGTIGGCSAEYRGFEFDPLANATFIYDKGPERTVIAFSTSQGPRTGDGRIAMPADFADFLETKMPALPVRFPAAFEPAIYSCAQPSGVAHGVHSIRYACMKLAQRQRRIARTDAAAYVPAQVLKTSPLRDILNDTRSRILAGGARNIDLDMARNTGGDEWRAACLHAKKSALVQGTPPPAASSAGSPDLFMPVGEPAAPDGGGGSGAALAALGGLAALAAVIGGSRG